MTNRSKHRRRGRSTLALAIVLAASVLPAAAKPSPARPSGSGADDAVVVAVIDFLFSPYHWDFSASRMPQHTDGDPGNDLPLGRAPHTWLPGFPNPDRSFHTYERFDLTLEEKDPDQAIAALDAADNPKWLKVEQSIPSKINYYWFPNTKVIGAVDFGGDQIHGATGNHGMGTTSVSVGNIHGACPECLMLFIDISGATVAEGEAAINWVMDQPWIDAVTNSYGYSLLTRDRFYSGSDVKAQRRATLRGQSIFFSAGNGVDGAFVVPNTTLFSSQEGPDWIVTVGAVSSENHGSYDHGRPADIAGIGDSYPSSIGARTVSESGPNGFGGTSNATPTIAGMYARALWASRVALQGPSRVQRDGVIARGKYRCARARRDCELGDGVLTVSELRTRLFHGALHTPAGSTTPIGMGEAPPVGEDEFLAEGYGSYFVREAGPENYDEEFLRIFGPLAGSLKALKRPAGEREWFIVDSFCRQHLWGSWKRGSYIEGRTELPGADPNWPVRSSIEETCPYLFPPV